MWFKCVGTDPEVVEEKQQQPFITAESGLVGTVTTSSNWSSDYVGWKAFIDDQNSEWCSNDTTSWFQYQFNSPVNIHKITYKNKDAQRFHPIDQVQCSDDGTNWTDLDITSVAGQCDITNKTIYASYWKIIFTDHSYQSSQYPALGSLALIGYEKIVLPDPIILERKLRQDFISQESELECTVSASSTFGGSWPAWKAFTNTSQDCWIAGATDSWWMVEFANAVNIQEIRYANLDANRFKPITAIYISDDGTNFTEVTPKTSEAGEVILQENIFAKYWKFTFEGYSASNQYPLLAHLELWGYNQVVPPAPEPAVYDRNIVITEVSTTAGSAKIKLSYYEEGSLIDETVVEATNVSGSANALRYQNMIKVYIDSGEWVIVALNTVEYDNLVYILNDEILRWSYANTGINYNIIKLTDYEERLTYSFLGYTDASPVTYEKVIDDNIESFSINNNSFVSNSGNRQGCYKEVTKAKIALYIKESSSGSYVQVADADYTLTASQYASNNYLYDITCNIDRYIYAVKVVFTDVYRVGAEIYYITKDEIPSVKYKKYAYISGSSVGIDFIGAGYIGKLTSNLVGEVYIKFRESEFKKNGYLFTASSVGPSIRVISPNNSDQYFRIFYSNSSSSSYEDIAYSTGEHEIIIDRYSDNKCIFDGTELEHTFVETNTRYSICSLSNSSNAESNPWKGYLEEIRLKDRSGNVIVDMLPCEYDGKACFYDKIGGYFYYYYGMTVMDTIPTT